MSQIVKVKREKIIACMTCSLCNNLLKQATTISLCLHTFCRKCIYERFSDDDVDTCPVCDINLGCVPMDKLRPDHNLQDIRSKIFPLKRRKVEALEVAPLGSLPTKIKEKSLSSLVGVTGRRTRAGVPKSASQSREGTPNKDDGALDDRVQGSSSPETLNKIIRNKKQSPAENNHEGYEGKVDLWKPLNTLVEAANRTKISKTVSQGKSPIKPDQSKSEDLGPCLTKVKQEDNGVISDNNQGDKSIMPSIPGPVKHKRVRLFNKTHACAEPSDSGIVLSEVRRSWRDGPVWFSLVASRDSLGGEPLPQVSSAFLRVKNGNMPVSSIQKYLVKKLDLKNEREIQLMCQGQEVLPHLRLSNLLDEWVQSSPNTKRIKTYAGNSGKEFVMVLSYSRNVTPPTS